MPQLCRTMTGKGGDSDDDDDSSGCTSAAASSVAATDSDDIARLEDTNMDPEDFEFVEPSAVAAAICLGQAREATTAIRIEESSSLNSDHQDDGDGDGSSSSPTSVSARSPLAPLYICEREGGGVDDGVMGRALLPPPPSVEEQKSMVKVLMQDAELTDLKAGQTRFVVEISWMRRWRKYVGWDTFDRSFASMPSINDPPGPITNEEVLEADGATLKEYHTHDVECVTGKMWDLLSGWYGGDPLERPVIEDYGRLMVELYPMKLKLVRKGGGRSDLVISKGCTLSDLRREGAAALKMGPLEDCEGLQLFEMTAESYKCRELSDDANTLSYIFRLSEALILFELPGDIDSGVNDDDDDCYSTTLTTNSWKSDYFSSSRLSSTPGAVGLNNLGNTCFMNAAIQCLSHIPQVVEYFGGKAGLQPFLQDLNLDNPLGTKGELAQAFGDLVRGMWEGKHSCIYPRDFLDVLCDHAQQFLGYEQHDSQEFLAYLLDGIHEDVNRIREKPFVEKVEANSGECDEMAARRAWEAHLRRNDSFVVDTMHGQYKSVVTCPLEGCGKTSTTFDPAMYLSVPLPIVAEKSVEVVLATLDGCRPRRYGVLVSKTAKLKEVRRALSKVCGKREESLLFADTWQHKIQSILGDEDLIAGHRMDDIYVFEQPEWPEPPPLPADYYSPSSNFEDSSSASSGGEFGGSQWREEGSGAGGWEQKLTPFLIRIHKEKELRRGSQPDGRSRLLKEAQAYLDRFSPVQGFTELALRQKTEDADDNDCDELRLDLKQRLKQASDHECSFSELNTLEEVAGFGEAVQSLRALVAHEQRDTRVQIIQHRSSEFDSYSRQRSYNKTTPFCFPLVVSYLPHSTTVGEFRNTVAVFLRRIVLPYDARKKGDGMEVDFLDEEGGVQISVGDDRLDAPAAESKSSTPGAGDPANVVRLFRSGELELLAEGPAKGHERNILGGGDDLDDDLLSTWISDSPFYPTNLMLKWSDDALREAFDAAEANKVLDDASVEACRNRTPKTLNLNECLGHFLEREQLDESEMWYCSSCKEHRRAYKELSLWRLPPVLVMHLKRFSYDTYGGWAASREKIESFVKFPVRGLDMRHLEHVSEAQRRGTKQGCEVASTDESTSSTGTAGSGENCPMDDWVVVSPQQQSALEVAAGSSTRCSAEHATLTGGEAGQANISKPVLEEGSEEGDETLYDLLGVVNHYGGLNGGHYTAFALNEHDDRWYDISDDRVSAVEDESDLVSSAAYVLFYQRRGTKEGSSFTGSKYTSSEEGRQEEDPDPSAGLADRYVKQVVV